MNIHHLELFYYVARNRGISEAVRKMPYGIQQPALSVQIIQLEQSLGKTLFQRRPFQLTAEGAKLFDFIQPFFDNLTAMAEQIRDGSSHHIAIGASELVLRDHLPGITRAVQKQFPKLRLSVRQGYNADLEGWLLRDEIDLAVTLIENDPPKGLHHKKLLDLPLVLLVPRASRAKTVDDFLARDRIEETLISLPPHDVIPRAFNKYLARRKVDWPIGMEVSSLDLIETYVRNGYGIGLHLLSDGKPQFKNARALLIPDCDPVRLMALWRSAPSALTAAYLLEMEQRAVVLQSAISGGQMGRISK
jgi:DNA-binding transcriptional LysR family regulator